MFDTHSLFGYSTIASITSDTGSILTAVVQTGDGAKFAVGQNVTLFPANVQPVKSNAYIGRVTAISTDTLTISYPQEGSTAYTATVGWQIANTITPKILTDIENLINTPEGFLINGQIVPSVASNNLTVAIKTLAGSDPSISSPVYVRIGNTIRSIISALSVTTNAGTNWFNSGGSQLATHEIDYFVYLGYNTTDGVTIGFARFIGRQYSDFNTTNTNEKYCAISTITNAVAGDYYEVIGRFAATLSTGTGYTWTIPTFTAINLIQKPIYETRILTYNPTITTDGGNFTNNPTFIYINYKLVNNFIFVDMYGTFGNPSGGSGRVQVGVPFISFNQRTGGYGMDLTTSKIYAVAGYSLAEQLLFELYDGTTPAINGDLFSVTMNYLI